MEKKLIAGLPLSRWYKGLDSVLLLACTEKNSSEDVRKLAAAMADVLK